MSLFSSKTHQRGVLLSGHPDGFFMNNVLWFGDANSGREVPVARGFEILPVDPTGLGDYGLLSLRDSLVQTFALLGSDHHAQLRWSMNSDYRKELEIYNQETDAIEVELKRKEAAGEWAEAETFQVYERRVLFMRLWDAMEKNQLKRERLHLYIGRKLPIPSRRELGTHDFREHVDQVSKAEALRIEELFGNSLKTLHPGAEIRAMTDQDHFQRAEYYSAPLRHSSFDDSMVDRLDLTESIGINNFTREWRVPTGEPGVSYIEDGVPHALLVMLLPPKSTYPAEIPKLMRTLGFQDIEIVLNVKQLDVEKVVKRLEKESGEADAVVQNAGALRHAERIRALDKKARIEAYQSGARTPYGVLYTFHLWAPSPAKLRSRVEILEKAIEGMRGAKATLVTLPGSVRHTYANAWPGWWCGSYEHYYTEMDCVNVADLAPWSGTFVGETDGFEAIFDGPHNSLVFMRTTQPDGQPRHALTFGKTRGGKTTFTNAWMMQIRHRLHFTGICESGRSLVVGSALEGVEPLVISPSGNQTLNPFDPGQNPLTPEFFAFITNFLLGRLGLLGGKRTVSESEEVSHRRSILVENLHALYGQVFRSTVLQDGETLERLRRFAVLAHRRVLHSRKTKQAVSYGDAALQIVDDLSGVDHVRWQITLDQLSTVSHEELDTFTRLEDSRRILRDLSFIFIPPDRVPTMSRFQTMLDSTPASDPSNRDICRRMAQNLLPWCAKGGMYGQLFDGISTVQISGRRFHVETGDIDTNQKELRVATHEVVAGMMMQYIKRLPRGQRKLIHFPELAEVLSSEGGDEMLMLLSTQIGKYGGILSAEIQQYDLLRQSSIATTVLANASQRFFLRQPDPQDAEEVGERARLTAPHIRMIQQFPTPSAEGSYFLLNVENGPTGPGICRPSNGLLYASESSGATFDKRKAILAEYPSLAIGLIEEGEKAAREREARAAGRPETVHVVGPTRRQPTAPLLTRS